MKILFLMICAGAGLFLSAAEQRFTMRAESPRIIEIGTRKIHTPVKNGKINFEVVVPSGADSQLKEAGNELCSLLGSMCGMQISPVKEASGLKFAIRIGYAGDSLKLDRDGFRIKTEGNGVEILGAREGLGVQFAVYDFLERFAGARFYFPGRYGTILPELKNWSLPEINITDRPDHQHRKINWRKWGVKQLPWYEGASADLGKELALFNKRLRCSTNRLPNCHGLTGLELPRRFAKPHPEYFALNKNGKRMDGTVGLEYQPNKNGQICFSSPGLKEVIYEDAVAALTGKPSSSRGIRFWQWTQQKPFFNIMPNDGMTLCRCEGCWKAFSQHPQAGGKNPMAASEFIWRWKTDLAGRLQKNGIPGYVTSMAYHVYTPVPDNIDFPSNMIIMLASYGPWGDARKALREEGDRQIQAWYRKLGTKLYMWNYPTKCVVNVPLIPNTSPHAVVSYYKRNFPYSFGAYFEAESDCWLFGYLNYYMFSKVMWDCNADADVLLKEHCRIMFGGGAEQMYQFFNIMENHWLNDIASNSENTALGPKTMPPSEFKMWNSIFTQAERKRINGLLADAVRNAGSTEHADRIRYIRKYFWMPVESAADDYVRRSNAKDEWIAWMPELELKETVLIDGRMEEAVWKTLEPYYLLPRDTDSAEVNTTVRMFSTKKDLYFLMECEEPETSAMRIVEREKDDPKTWSDNAVEIHLNPTGDRNEDFQIIVNALGNLTDLRIDAAKYHYDRKWDSGAEVKTQIIPGRKWVAEVRIPRNALPALQKNMTGNFTRIRSLRTEPSTFYAWSWLAKTFGDIANFGIIRQHMPPSANLLKDGDFRKDYRSSSQDGWFDWGGYLQRDTKIYRTAGASIRLDKKHVNLVHRLPDLKPDTEYVFRFYMKIENIVNPGDKQQVGGFTCRIDDGAPAGGVRYFPSPAYIGTMQWQCMEYRFRTSPEAGKKKRPILYFSIPRGDGRAWVDSVRLEELK